MEQAEVIAQVSNIFYLILLRSKLFYFNTIEFEKHQKHSAFCQS